MSDGNAQPANTPEVSVVDLTRHENAADRVVTLPVTPEEDALLRRLAQFERLGATLAPTMAVLKSEIRSRDRRAEIRLPGERWLAS